MAGYTKLFSTILGSTIWEEDNATRILWITMLASADKEGRVEASVPGLATFARLSVEDTRKSLEKLKAPDKDSRTQDNEGRRIIEIDGGWLIYNYVKYRRMLSADERREYKAAWMRNKRNTALHVDSESTSGQNGHIAEADAEAESKEVQKAKAGECQDTVRSMSGHKSQKDMIEALYQAYPKKVDRGHALNMIAKALKLAPFEQLIESVEAYAECVAGSDMKYVPNPGTWFNGRRWEDDRSQWKQNGKPALTVQDYNRMIARLEKEAQDWYNRHWTVYNGMDDKWDCTENGERYREMKAKIEEWKRKVEEMA